MTLKLLKLRCPEIRGFRREIFEIYRTNNFVRYEQNIGRSKQRGIKNIVELQDLCDDRCSMIDGDKRTENSTYDLVFNVLITKGSIVSFISVSFVHESFSCFLSKNNASYQQDLTDEFACKVREKFISDVKSSEIFEFNFKVDENWMTVSSGIKGNHRGKSEMIRRSKEKPSKFSKNCSYCNCTGDNDLYSNTFFYNVYALFSKSIANNATIILFPSCTHWYIVYVDDVTSTLNTS